MQNLPSKRDAMSVILYYENQQGESKASLSRRYDMPKSTLLDYIKHGAKLSSSLSYDDALYVLSVTPPKPIKRYEEAVQKIYQLSTSDSGITSKQESTILDNCGLDYKNDKKHVRKKVRQQAKENSFNALFVPSFLVSPSHSAREIRDELMLYADALHNRINELVLDFRQDFDIPATATGELKNYLVRLACDDLGGVPVTVLCETLDNVVNVLCPVVDNQQMTRKQELNKLISVIDLSMFNPNNYPRYKIYDATGKTFDYDKEEIELKF